MKCPHCGYTHGTHWEETTDGDTVFRETKGALGPFFCAHVTFHQVTLYSDKTAEMHACPQCTKTFIEL